MERRPSIVLDTNVIYAGLRSSRGASHLLLSLLGKELFEIVISVPLVLEYEHALSDLPAVTPLTSEHITDVIDFLCSVGRHQEIFFLWRPTLRDPADDMVLEVAVAGGCQFIVTFNVRDFKRADRFGPKVVTPVEFLSSNGALP